MTVTSLPQKSGPQQSPREGHCAEVIPLFGRAVQSRRSEGDAKAQAYALYLQSARIDETDIAAGIALYEQALELDPGLALARTNLGNCHYRSGRTGEARACYEKALSLDPKQPEALYNLGYISIDKDLDWAIFLFEAAVANDPAFADAWYNLGKAYERRLGTRRSPKVRLCFVRYLKYTSDASEFADVARTYCSA